MRYPVLSRAVAAEVVQELIRGEQPELDAFVTWEGSGPKLNSEPFADTAASLHEALKNFEMSDARADADMFKVKHRQPSTKCWPSCRSPSSTTRFWRYLSLVHFWWLAQWRHPSAFDKRPGLYLRYVDGVLTTECVLSRMYLRAQIAEIDGDYSHNCCGTRLRFLAKPHPSRLNGSKPTTISGATARTIRTKNADRSSPGSCPGPQPDLEQHRALDLR